MVFRIAFRNLFRQRRRSLLTALTMAVGFLLCSVSLGISDGTYLGLIEMFTRAYTGHFQVHAKGYLDRPSIYRTVDEPEVVGERIARLSGVASWTPRVFGSVLAVAGKKTMGARLIGVRPEQEAGTTRLKEKVSEGRYLSGEVSAGALLGRELADALQAEVGDEVALLGQAADGSIANDLFQVVGILGRRGEGGEGMICYTHLEKAQEFLTLPGRVHEIAVVLEDAATARETAARARKALDSDALEVSPWQVVEKQFYQAMQADLKGMWISLGIIMLIVGIGVLNTVLMTILERTREFGVLRALGTRPGKVFGLIVTETALLAVVGIVAGSALGLACNSLLAEYGIAYPEPVEFGGYTFDRMESRVTFQTFWIPAAVTFGTAVAVSMFPAVRAARVDPAHAMRSH